MNTPIAQQDLKHILFYTDFSPYSLPAFEAAVQQALHNPGSRLHLVHVVPEPEAQFWKTYLYENEKVDNKAHLDMSACIHDTYITKLPKSISMDIIVRGGIAREVILETAVDVQADILIFALSPHHTLNHLLGDETRKILKHAPCPVLLVPALT